MTKKDERDEDCAGGCSRIGVDADRAGRAAGLVSTIATLGGVAAGVAGIWLVLSTPDTPAVKIGRLRVRALGPYVSVAGSF